MAIKIVDIEYHKQDTENFCGPACAQMVLHQPSLLAGDLIPLYDQADLFPRIQGNNSIQEMAERWASGPIGLEITMLELNPALDRTFALYIEGSADIISKKIVWTIHHYNIAPIALVFDYIHWIVVTGYDVSVEPAGVTDTSYVINGFWINNPWQGLVSPPPPHFLGDRCGSGGDYGTPNEHVYYDEWIYRYMKGVSDGQYAGKYIAICDPEPAPEKIGKRKLLKRHFDGEKIIDKHIAVECTLKALHDHGLLLRESHRKMMETVQPAEPFLVQYLDNSNDFYYIVPMMNTNKNIYSLVSIDARFGNYKQSCYAKNMESPIFFEPMDRKKILKLLGKRIEFKETKMVVMIYPEAVCIYPSLVWKPCAESLSPYMPFHMVTIGKSQLYVRIDGKVFTKLTTDVRGI